jgi:hypothetical protein
MVLAAGMLEKHAAVAAFELWKRQEIRIQTHIRLCAIYFMELQWGYL